MQVRVDQRVTNRKSLYFFCEFSLHRLWQKSNLSTKLLSGRHLSSRQIGTPDGRFMLKGEKN